MILRARTVLPISGPAIPDGAIAVRWGRIASVGRWAEVRSSGNGRCVDLGDVILLPGLINAHCHLDYTQMAGQFPPPRSFTDWLKLIMTTKAGWSVSEFTESWLDGAQMLVRTGTTTVGDIEAFPELLPEVWTGTPLRVISFLEMLGITNRRQPGSILQDTLDKMKSLPRGRCEAALSPHAPYSTLPELLRLTAKAARRQRRLVCSHVAESALEFSMFAHGAGDMFEWLRRSGRDMSDCGLGSPVQHLERCGLLGSNLLAAHVNYLAPKDVALLQRRGVSVVHCPRSHFYFRHGLFPLKRLQRAGVNICLGTDSLASVCKRRNQAVELNLFDEMRVLSNSAPFLPPRKILEMATRNGARALGKPGKLGELRQGAFADWIALPVSRGSSDVYETVLQHTGPLIAAMIGGRWTIAPAGVSKGLGGQAGQSANRLASLR